MQLGTEAVLIIQGTLVLALVHPSLNGLHLETPRSQVPVNILWHMHEFLPHSCFLGEMGE